MPWPEYPCHPCSGPEHRCMHWPQRDPLECWAEADGYYWHTASWNLTTGRWRAQCCAGHSRKGQAA